MRDFGELGLRNRRAVPWKSVPRESLDSFRESLVQAVADGWRLVSLFGMPERDDQTRLVAVLADDVRGDLMVSTTVVDLRYPALTLQCAQADRFEREIAEQCGVVPEGHPWLKPLRRHPPDHVSPARRGGAIDREAHPFFRIEGDEVHEVAVGPVHAGIIEPGHFRFQAHGETVLFLEIMLGYQHRGVERLLETLDSVRGVLLAESIAGDTVIGHAEAYCGALEALARTRKTPRAQTIRGIALELERLANHIGDLGAMAGDVAYAPAAAYLGRLRGECLNLLMTLSGNRYGRGLVRPGGAGFDIPPEMAAYMHGRLEGLRDEVEPVLDLMFQSASVQARFEGVGIVPKAACGDAGLVGPVARACEMSRDVRQDHPYGIFRFAHIPVATAWAGDVLARALVRRLEIQRSLAFLIEQLGALPRGEARVSCGPLRPDELVVAMVEGWRGEIVHVVITDDTGSIRRHKVTDPSFHNWAALALAMPGNEISDFPLCNKSFNLSYAGHDL
ncbi:MAG TPA: NADH-quinone oxidoreductase subunit C [Gemmatimonadales bacterium]|jgi:Ni,Fe-hydrogenase III large subunit/Ni,Fe-hydrogenase III component G|nr:NADH-quinone oxidoreductase subunit C [Gemmatimonadales bacterium]